MTNRKVKPLGTNTNVINCPLAIKGTIKEAGSYRQHLVDRITQLRKENTKRAQAIENVLNSKDVEQSLLDMFSEVKKLLTENERLGAELKGLKIYQQFLTDELEKVLENK